MTWLGDDMLAIVFLALMGIAMLMYAVLDGYDLGIGMLIVRQPEKDRDRMIAAIGPFWDANETWLVLGVGVLLVAFPVAHGRVLGALYVPVSLMLAGLILRGVSFDFRAKAKVQQKRFWDHLFFTGSLLTALTQGYMLGLYIVGFESGVYAQVFALTSALCVSAAYMLIGASWLILKSSGDLQLKSIAWAQKAVLVTGVGLILVSVINPLASEAIFIKWFTWPQTLLLLPLPMVTAMMLWLLRYHLTHMPYRDDRLCWLPFCLCLVIFILAFSGLAYSFYPFIVPQQLTVWEAAAAPESLRVVLLGCAVVLPAILAYTALSYWIFRGKSTDLNYY
ncbi:MAG: cytochrome d ubiquinol oxidase subunit II [Gammaproteobacteria bacterium]|nr:cytochrome d ubiquinol oxidase subunit II [Gammaproteobacteria bacterium]